MFTMLIYVGALLVVSGGIAIGLHRTVAARATRLLGRRPTPVAQVLHDGPLRIDGTVAVGEQGTLVARCSGEVVVWFRLRLRNIVPTGGEGQSCITVIDEHAGTLVSVVIGLLESLRVRVQDPRAILVDRQAPERGRFALPHVRGLLAASLHALGPVVDRDRLELTLRATEVERRASLELGARGAGRFCAGDQRRREDDEQREPHRGIAAWRGASGQRAPGPRSTGEMGHGGVVEYLHPSYGGTGHPALRQVPHEQLVSSAPDRAPDSKE